MKHFTFISAVLIAITGMSYAQGQQPVNDTHPNATIYIYDPQSSQEVLAESDDAVLFKDALIDLANNTNEGMRISRTGGHRTIVITQASPDQGNAFQITMDTKMFGRVANLYTFSYNVDQNTLYYLDPNTQAWTPELVQGNNVVLLNNCLSLGRFNDPQAWNAPTDDNDADVDVQANTAPPVLQDEVQPECPVDGYLWQPGYWAFNPNAGNYYWVRGEWVEPPTPGYLWTPPYWGFEGGIYGFHRGYWGLTIGFYGGINYGYGYVGHGYYGGRWEGGRFRYNTAVVRVNVNVVHNVYVDRTVIVNKTVVRKVSYNGPGGVDVKPTKDEVVATKEKHIRDVKQDPSAPKSVAANPGRGQRNGNGTAPNNNNPKTPGNNINNPKIPGTDNNNVSRTPGNNNNGPKAPGNDNNFSRTPGNNINNPKTPGTDNNIVSRAPGNNNNSQKVPGNDKNTPRVPGNGPGVPRVPGNGTGAARVNGTDGQRQNPQQQNGGQRQQGQGQRGNNNKQAPAKTDKNPPAKDQKNP